MVDSPLIDLQDVAASGLAGDDYAGPELFCGIDATLGAIFRAFGGAYLEHHGATASDEQRRVLQLMALCRTSALGTAHWECGQCGYVHEIHNPCRDRHCGSCGAHLARQWHAAHETELLPLKHAHRIFTAPHEIQVLLDAWANRRLVYDAYLRAAHDALCQLAAATFGIRIGAALLLHTWNQWQMRHVHVHAIWPNGGWSIDQPDRFITVDASQLDSEALMRAFRAGLLRRLCFAAERGRLVLTGEAAALDDAVAFGHWIEALAGRAWILRCPPPRASGAPALAYLARYARRVAIDNRRILELDARRGTVTFGYRKNEAGPSGEDVQDTMTIDGVEFIRRYLDHVMPKGMGRARFYGWWSPGRKGTELPRIRAALGVPPPDGDAPEAAPDGEGEEEPVDAVPVARTCPACKEKTLERLWHDPIPRLWDLMQLILWPQQRRQPVEHQPLLPGMATWVPGGDAFHASVFAQTSLAHTVESPASGFT